MKHIGKSKNNDVVLLLKSNDYTKYSIIILVYFIQSMQLLILQSNEHTDWVSQQVHLGFPYNLTEKHG